MVHLLVPNVNNVNLEFVVRDVSLYSAYSEHNVWFDAFYVRVSTMTAV